jgi:hypothetical protein
MTKSKPPPPGPAGLLSPLKIVTMKPGSIVKIKMPDECNPNLPIDQFKSLWGYFRDMPAIDKIFFWDVKEHLERAGIDFQYLWLSGKNFFIVDKVTAESVWIRLKGQRKKNAVPLDKRQLFRLEIMHQ